MGLLEKKNGKTKKTGLLKLAATNQAHGLFLPSAQHFRS